jgi:hypothetical protein
MSDEEYASYAHYDLDTMFRPTSSQYLLDNFKILIQHADVDLGATYFKTITEAADREKAERAHAQVEAEKSETTTQHPVGDKPAATESATGVARRAVKEAAPAATTLDVKGTLLKLQFGAKLTERDLKEMEGAIQSFDGITPVYKGDAALAPCNDTCKWPNGSATFLPTTVMNCPACGTEYEEAAETAAPAQETKG